ncbi:MAG: asparaginase domain-containing protein [Sphingobacterium sp.]|nr:asparaginase domain-containing protein [Sphingobacterium sp.]
MKVHNAGQEGPRPDGPGHDRPARPRRGRGHRRARPGGRRRDMLMAGNDDYKGYRGEALDDAQELRGPGLERRRDPDLPRRLHGHHPAALRDGRPPPHRHQAPLGLQHRPGGPLDRGRRRSAAARKPTTRSPRRSSPSTRPSPRSSSSARAGRSPAASTTGPGPSSRPSRRASSTAPVPELADICNLETEKLFGVFSENMGPEQYIATAKAIGREIEKGVQGIVIGHGTDTMHHTAAILSFMVQDSPVPIVMVGSQRSSDRPSSDAALNLMHSVKTAAESDIAEVMVCMFGPTSDTYGLLHRGTRVRKMHSSYRSTFRTIGDIPIAMVSRDKITPLRQDYKRRRPDRVGQDRHGLRGARLHRLLLPEHEAGHHRLAHRQRLPRHRHRRDGTGPRQQTALSGAEAGPGQGHRRLHDRPDALGLRPDVRLRHGARHDGARRHPGREHAARGGLRQAGLGARQDRRPRGGPADHADADRRRDHGTGAVQRLPHLPGRHSRGRGVHLDHQEVGTVPSEDSPSLELEAQPQPHDPRVEDLVVEPVGGVGRRLFRIHVIDAVIGVVGPVDDGRIQDVEDVDHRVQAAAAHVELLLEPERQVAEDGEAVLRRASAGRPCSIRTGRATIRCRRRPA